MVAKKGLLWILRLLIYGLAILISFVVIMPALGGIIGLIIAALFAAVAIGLETALTAKLSGQSLEAIAGKRILTVDQVLSNGHTADNRPHLEEAETVDAEVIEPSDRRQIESHNHKD